MCMNKLLVMNIKVSKNINNLKSYFKAYNKINKQFIFKRSYRKDIRSGEESLMRLRKDLVKEVVIICDTRKVEIC